jgi:hypothetical protein
MAEMLLLEMVHSISVDDFDARTVCAFYSGGVHLTLRWPTANLIGGNWKCETASAQMESRNERTGGKKLRGLTIRFHANGLLNTRGVLGIRHQRARQKEIIDEPKGRKRMKISFIGIFPLQLF